MAKHEQKIVDTSLQISVGGRSERYWLGRELKGKNAERADTKDSINITKLLTKYNLKGFEFGNWLNNADRYDHLMAAQKSLEDLSKIMGTTNLGQDGLIGIAFGARGKSAARAHYEPSTNMINLTKMNGAGSLAHEWAHSIDFNFGRYFDQNKDYAALSGKSNSVATTLPSNTGGELRTKMNLLVDTIKQSNSHARLNNSHEYWRRRIEVFARFTEQYCSYKLKLKSLRNNYLSKPWTFYLSESVYLTDSDFKKVLPLADDFFKSLSAYLNGKRTALKQVDITRPKTAAKQSKQAKAKSKPKAKTTTKAKTKPKNKQPKVKQGSLFSRR